MARAKKFGVFGGVFTPSILTILGVIMYLRLPWITGQAGLILTLSIIFVAHIISGSTGLSVSSIATDKKIGTGGAYYIISRSLGLPIGGTLGIALFLGLSFSVSLYLIGFTEVLLNVLNIEPDLTSIRIGGSAILVLITAITLISTTLNIRIQYLIMAVMILSLISIFFGRHEFSPEKVQLEQLPGSLPWITLFAIFFPAVTGFEAGVSMSGDLKDPGKAIPFGTLTAILTGLFVYIGLALFFSSSVNRQLLVYDKDVLTKIALVPSLVTAGILGATLSSALGSINAAPRIMQAISRDRITPFFLGKGYGPSDEPRIALVLAFVIAEAGILIGELNAIARFVTIFFVITYGFINITYTIESWASSDFTPSFRIPRIVSIIGAITCIVVMIQLDILAFIFSSFILAGVFLYLRRKELTLQTGDTRSSFWLSLVRTGLMKLTSSRITRRNWRPNLILFSGGTGARPHLIEMGKALVGKFGIFTNFVLIESKGDEMLIDKKARVSFESSGNDAKIITRRHAFSDIYEGISMISRIYGFSGFEPNTILMGLPRNPADPQKSAELMVTLHKLDYNLTFLSYDRQTGFGAYKTIDLWWSGEGQNLSFALHLLRFITAFDKWRHASVRILAISNGSINAEKYYSVIGHVIESFRTHAEIKVINNIEKLPEEDIIRSESYNTDLILLELPHLTTNKIGEINSYAHHLASGLRTCLFIHASSFFEEISVTGGEPVRQPPAAMNNPPASAVLEQLDFSKTEALSGNLKFFATLVRRQTDEFLNDTISRMLSARNEFNTQFLRLAEDTSDKLKLAEERLLDQETRLDYLRILEEFADSARAIITRFRDNHLKYENQTLRKGIFRFIQKTEADLENLPRQIRRTFKTEEFRNYKGTNILQNTNRSILLLWMKMTGRSIHINIRVLPAARFFMLHKRLEFFRNFNEKYTEQCVRAFADIRELLARNRELIEGALSGNIKSNRYDAEKLKLERAVGELNSRNHNFFNEQGNNLIKELSGDLGNLSRIIEGPRANYLSGSFRKAGKKSLSIRDQLNDFPDLFSRFILAHVNKSYLDFIFLALKSRLEIIIDRAYQEIVLSIEESILKNLDAFEFQITSIADSGFRQGQNRQIITRKMITSPSLHDIFSNLLMEIDRELADLPVSIDISGDVPQPVDTARLENMNYYIVPVRKTASYYVSSKLGEQIRKSSGIIAGRLSTSVSYIRNLIRLAGFNLDNLTNQYVSMSGADQSKILMRNLLSGIESEKKNLKQITTELKAEMDSALDTAFDPLASVLILKTSSGLGERIRETDREKLSSRLIGFKKAAGAKLTGSYVNLLYSRSDAMLWASRYEQSREKSLLLKADAYNRIIKDLSPDNKILNDLPFYYSSLFAGSSSIGEDFWVGMKKEIAEADIIIRKFREGKPGALIITGERSSGKSSLSRHLSNLHFQKENIFIVKAPRECTADAVLFEEILGKSINCPGTISDCLDNLPSGSAIIINDLELWWERKPGGTAVVDRIMSLLRQYGSKIMFIINVNLHAFKLIDHLTSINSLASGVIICQPFDARETGDLIITRHRASGMKFILGRKDEKDLNQRDYARLFNRIFNLSSGNPGYAMNVWLAGIRIISEKTLYIDEPPRSINELPDPESEETIFILQFIFHRRLTTSGLSELLMRDSESIERVLEGMIRKGILVEKFRDVYSLNPSLELHLVKKLKNSGLL